MGRLLAVLLLVQISLPGFCCIANRAARSTARLIGFAPSAESLTFWNSSCCGSKCCVPDAGQDGDCCSYASGCCNQPATGTQCSEQSEHGTSNRPLHHKVCECLDSDPMILPSTISLDLDSDCLVTEFFVTSYPSLASSGIRTARYHPPPIRRHLLLCVIRC